MKIEETNNAIFVGNWQYSKKTGGRGFAGATYDPIGICPTMTTMQGGNREPMIIVKNFKEIASK